MRTTAPRTRRFSEYTSGTQHFDEENHPIHPWNRAGRDAGAHCQFRARRYLWPRAHHLHHPLPAQCECALFALANALPGVLLFACNHNSDLCARRTRNGGGYKQGALRASRTRRLNRLSHYDTCTAISNSRATTPESGWLLVHDEWALDGVRGYFFLGVSSNRSD